MLILALLALGTASPQDIAAAAKGQRIVRCIDTGRQDEVAFKAVVRLPISLTDYLDRLRKGTLYRANNAVRGIGRFSETPVASDVPTHLNPSALIAAIAEFEKQGRPSDCPDLIRQRLPAGCEYLASHTSNKGADDFYLWTELDFGFKAMTRVAQLSIWHGKPNEAIVLTRQIYANRYFDSSLQIDQLIADGDGVYLITHNYGRSGWLSGITGKLIRPIVVSRTLALTDKTLETAINDLKRERQ